MSYETKPGSFSLFKNDKDGGNPNWPDYKGSGVDLNGNDFWVSAWIKKSKNGVTYMSCSMQSRNPKNPKELSSSPKSNAYEKAKEQVQQFPDNDDIPF